MNQNDSQSATPPPWMTAGDLARGLVGSVAVLVGVWVVLWVAGLVR